MATTDKDLYRSVRKEKFPNGTVVDNVAVQGILYPSFEAQDIVKNGRVTGIRPADIRPYDKQGEKVVDMGHGTSLFDRDNVFPQKYNWSFKIPEGTIVPESLIVLFTHYNDRFAANHYQIEPAKNSLPVQAYKGALDNLARNAVVKLCKGSKD